MTVEIDSESGFCFGVVRAIDTAERELRNGVPLYCLGDIVHNGQEVDRLASLGLKTIGHADLPGLEHARVLFRAHGEPPATYSMARKHNMEIVDATCPVVLRLQQKIKAAYTAHPEAQIVIYGKPGHAEVIGLEGQTDGTAVVVENIGDLQSLDFSRPVILFSQTTKPIDGLQAVVRAIEQRMQPGVSFEYHDTVCRQVANRIPNIRRFASEYDVVLFVAGAKSSNGKVLFHECRDVNPKTYLVSSPGEVEPGWLDGAGSVGICGATSTPAWLMEVIRDRVMEMQHTA
ncbi:MAG: 4-hydroxy-3-methylbut-2-enyl diphosphate reductase [Candidatus Aphodosoma sp.]